MVKKRHMMLILRLLNTRVPIRRNVKRSEGGAVGCGVDTPVRRPPRQKKECQTTIVVVSKCLIDQMLAVEEII
jgi:hypothetical protein